MKAVVYHTDASIAEKFPKDTYKDLLNHLRKNCNDFNIPLVHITVNGFEGYGNENIYVDADPENIVWNREKFFIEFLKNSDPNETYFFTEPDSRIKTIFPPLSTDLAMLYRNVPPHITPAWRLAKKSALPIFEEVFETYNISNKLWDSDCTAWHNFFSKLDLSGVGETTYKNLSIELRWYKHYCMKKGKFTCQFKGKSKKDLHQREKIRDQNIYYKT